MGFVVKALEEKLARSRGAPKRRGAKANYKSAFRNCMRNRGHNVID
jgi:hypothetical protein